MASAVSLEGEVDMKRVAIVGAGFSGAVIARELAAAGHVCVVMEERDHIAGNCHTERDASTGIMVHRYGPHIFHTGIDRVWQYVNQFSEFMPYVNRVKAVSGGRVYTLPINLLTINQFFGKTFSPGEAAKFIESIAETGIVDPETFEDQALRFVGRDLYYAFFRGYTLKQWGIDPKDLPASILKRLPLRFNYDDNYFNHPHQGMPKDGYTKIVEKILDVDRVELRLGVRFEDFSDEFDHVIYSGPIDRYFDYSFGRLGYRTLDFERIDADGDFQGTAVMNYCDQEVPFTRITEHKYFATWEADSFGRTVCFREFSRACGPADIPYYPIRQVREKSLLRKYVERAEQEQNITFVGRLGTYSYLDMDVTIDRALDTSEALLSAWASDSHAPVFVHSPI